jgi:hypothetical protein
MNPLNEESLRKGYRLAVYICCAMIASVFIYAGVAEFLAVKHAPFHGFSPLPPAVYDRLRLILLGVALLDFALIPFIRNRALTAARRTGTASVSPLPEPVQKMVAASMISFALCESIAIYGLVLFLVNGGRKEFYLFLLIALVAFAIHFPRFERWQEWVQTQYPMTGDSQ